MAYQIAFDLEEIATQDFLSKVASNLPVQEDVSKDESKGTLDFDLLLSVSVGQWSIQKDRLDLIWWRIYPPVPWIPLP